MLHDEHGNTATSVQYALRHIHSSDATVVDLGCRFGSLLANLVQRGIEDVYGFDIDAYSIERGRLAYPVLSSRLGLSDGTAIPLQENSVDVVAMFDVFEHLRQPAKVLVEIRRILKPNGKLVFQTPNVFINIPWEIIQTRSVLKWRTYHGNIQSKWTLRRALAAAGFRQIQIEKFSIVTEHNKAKVKRILGPAALPLLRVLESLPMAFYPNFFGHATNP